MISVIDQFEIAVLAGDLLELTVLATTARNNGNNGPVTLVEVDAVTEILGEELINERQALCVLSGETDYQKRFFDWVLRDNDTFVPCEDTFLLREENACRLGEEPPPQNRKPTFFESSQNTGSTVYSNRRKNVVL